MSVLGKHTAVPSFDGYLYQLQAALRTLVTLDFGESLGIEMLDDLHVEDGTGGVDLTQLKYHQDGTELTDFSVDLWKTLGIWSLAILAGEIDVKTTKFALLTTASAKSGTCVEAWVDGADLRSIEADLVAIAKKTTNGSIKEYAQAFIDLDATRAELLNRVRILPNQPSITGLEIHVRKALIQGGFRQSSIDIAVERLCGWLYKQIIDKRYTGWLIHYEDFHNALATIRDEMKSRTVESRYGTYAPSPEELAGQANAVYVQQLTAVDASDRLKTSAIISFCRVARERTDWIRFGEVMPHDLKKFDEEVERKWQTAFEDMQDNLASSATGPELASTGLRFYRRVYSTWDIPIKPGWLGQYFTQGSLHHLADIPKIGWHPEWEKRFK